MRIITISAKKRHGKDTVSDYIASTGNYVKYALASPFKKTLKKYFCFSEDVINGINYDREKHIVGLTDYKVKRLFKLCLKDLGYDYNDYEIDWSVCDKNDVWSVRKLMQTIGTDIGCNQIDRLIWIHPMIKLYNAMITSGTYDGLIVTDCRQEWEIDTLRQMNALVIHLKNKFIISNDRHSTEKGLSHKQNEPIIHNDFDPKKLTDIDYKNEQLEKLYKKIDKIL